MAAPGLSVWGCCALRCPSMFKPLVFLVLSAVLAVGCVDILPADEQVLPLVGSYETPTPVVVATTAPVPVVTTAPVLAPSPVPTPTAAEIPTTVPTATVTPTAVPVSAPVAVPVVVQGGRDQTVRLAIGACESGGRVFGQLDYTAEHGGDRGGFSSASGAYQFLDSTWMAYGHGARTGTTYAADASPAQQDEAFWITFDMNGLSDWWPWSGVGCADRWVYRDGSRR